MPVRLLRSDEIAALERFPVEPAAVVVGAHYTLTDSDLTAVRLHRGEGSRLGYALQLCAIRHLGYVPADLAEPPVAVVGWLAEQLRVDPAALAGYGTRYKTMLEHRGDVLARLGYRSVEAGDLKRLGDWLVERALEHERARLLFEEACAWLRAESLLRPGVSVVERAVVTARGRAVDELASRLSPIIGSKAEELDAVLTVDPARGCTPLSWLAEPATVASGRGIHTQFEKLRFLDTLGADRWDVTALVPNRRRQLAGEAKRRTNQALARMRPQRRRPILVAFGAERRVELIDELVELADQVVERSQSRAGNALDELKKTVAVAAADKVALFTRLARLVLDPAIPAERLRTVIFDELGEQRLVTAVAEADALVLPDGNAYLDLLARRYPQLRTWTPEFLDTLDFRPGPGGADLIAAIELLRELNRTGRRGLPDDAPTGFVPPGWRQRVVGAAARPDRRAWELCLLAQLRIALRSGQVWVTGSRRYNDPALLLLPTDTWHQIRGDAVPILGVRVDPADQLRELTAEFHDRMAALDRAIGGDTEMIRLDDGRLVVTPIAAEAPPEGMAELSAAVEARFPKLPLPELVIEVDSWCHFSDHLTHAAGTTARSADLDVHRYAALVALATNNALGDMADAAGLSYELLAWAAEWHLRPETLEPATAAVLALQHDHPLASAWGDGTRSSSDGQRFTVPVASTTSRWLPRYFGLRHRGLTIYTWTTDRWGQFASKVITASSREGIHALDALLDNALDYRPREHSTDTGGWTDNLFALCNLVGIQFAPRLADLADQKLYGIGPLDPYPDAGLLVTGRIDTNLIASQWDDLRRVGASLQRGWVTASLLLERWQARPRQNPLTRALQEYGRLQRTLFLLRYLATPAYRREIGRQLNRGETFHDLRQRVRFGQHGNVRRPHLDEQTVEALALNLVVGAITCWNTHYIADIIDQLRAEGWTITDDQLAHLSPARWRHINFLGTWRFDHQPPAGHRPLRKRRA